LGSEGHELGLGPIRITVDLPGGHYDQNVLSAALRFAVTTPALVRIVLSGDGDPAAFQDAFHGALLATFRSLGRRPRSIEVVIPSVAPAHA